MAKIIACNGYQYYADTFEVRIRINRKQMGAFRASAEGRAAERHVDVLDQGFGWWQITSKDEPCKLTGLPAWARAHISWIAELNKASSVAAQQVTSTVVKRGVLKEVREVAAPTRNIVAHRVIAVDPVKAAHIMERHVQRLTTHFSTRFH